MSRQLVIIDENALVTDVKTALLVFILTSVLLILVGLIILFVQARGLAKRMLRSQRQGQEIRKDVDRVVDLARKNNRDIVEGKDALDTLNGAWNFHMLQRGRHF
jgi:flagellar biosynthesis/type III secretory pathway M-ring protein FliF/YscJ